MDGRNPGKEDGEIVSDEARWSGFEIGGDFHSGNGEWKGYAAKNPIYFRTKASLRRLSVRRSRFNLLGVPNRCVLPRYGLDHDLIHENKCLVMVEQVDDASCSRIPLLGSSCANHAPREHADGTSHLSSRGSLTSGKRVSVAY
ncbi:unnamed protein product [Toxocara canis]|uniref:Uncharacterized protein n=1 Tax=Toxocara canis TaxID=6265 RepID=A0A3P7EYL3_TOXCA|nr:unnamed protein product [Toxocara canis]